MRNAKDNRLLIKGELEIDLNRGVVYFHASHPRPEWGTQTLLRVCRLDIPPDYNINVGMIDIIHMVGASYRDKQ